MLSGLGWVRRCMWVVFIQTKNGMSASCCRLTKSMQAATVSSSIVSIRFFVSGPVSSIRCFPTRPKRVLLRRVVLICRPGVDDAAGRETLAEVRVVVGGRVVRQLRFLLRVQVVEVAEELVEAVSRRQVLVQVAQMVLAEMSGRVAERLEQLGNRRIFSLEPDVGTRHAHLAQAGAEDALTGDERRAAGRAGLLAIGVGEAHPFFRDPVDVGRSVAHQPIAVAAEVRDADVVSPDHEDVRLGGSAMLPPFLSMITDHRP